MEPTAYGDRPGRTARQAVETAHRALCAGQTQVVDADVSQYFDTIPQAAVMQALAQRISDRKLLRLLKRWLKTPVAEQTGRGGWRYTGGKRATRGIPQGGVISPLLANLYMNRYRRASATPGWTGAMGPGSSPMPMTSWCCVGRGRQRSWRRPAVVPGDGVNVERAEDARL